MNGQVGVVHEPAGEVGPTGPGQLVRRDAEVGGEQAAQVPARDAEARRQGGLGGAVEGAGQHQLDGPAHQLRSGPSTGAGAAR